MKKTTSHWRTNIVAYIAIFCFVVAAIAVAFHLATFSEAAAFLSTIAMPLMYTGFRLSADRKEVDSNKYEGIS